VINSNFGPISHGFIDVVTYSLKLSTENCGQTTADGKWLLLTAYRKSPASYPMVSFPTSYSLPFSHNTARLVYNSALWLFKVIQGHRFMSFESQYATSYYWSIAT